MDIFYPNLSTLHHQQLPYILKLHDNGPHALPTYVIGNYKCTKSVNKNVRFSAKLISDFQNKYKKNY